MVLFNHISKLELCYHKKAITLKKQLKYVCTPYTRIYISIHKLDLLIFLPYITVSPIEIAPTLLT